VAEIGLKNFVAFEKRRLKQLIYIAVLVEPVPWRPVTNLVPMARVSPLPVPWSSRGTLGTRLTRDHNWQEVNVIHRPGVP